MRKHTVFVLVGISMLLVLLTGCAVPATGGTTATTTAQAGTTTPGTSQGSAEAAAYCTSKGGQVVTRYPAYDTNSSNPLRLSGSLQFCQFNAEDGTMISISVDTLYTDQPTLATAAYFQKPPLGETTTPGANPASAYCSKLGGSDLFGGQNAAGGGWILDDKNDTFYVLQACIFPDLSTIDSWGLTYHTNGTIRGTDLSSAIRFQPPSAPTPGIFDR
jgi:putative hemolysin